MLFFRHLVHLENIKALFSFNVFLTFSFNWLEDSLRFSFSLQKACRRVAVLSVVAVCVSAAAELTVWWGDGSSAERLLHAGGERAAQRGVETLQWAEEELWAREEEFYGSCYSSGTWGTECIQIPLLQLKLSNKHF